MSESQVLAIALDHLKEILNISNNDINEIIGVHYNTFTRSLNNKKIESKSKEGECSLLLIRIYRSLFALNGGTFSSEEYKTINIHHFQSR